MTATPTAANASEVARALTPAVNVLLIARANAELTRKRIDPIAREVLAGFDYRVDLDTRLKNHGEQITDPKDLYQTEADCGPYYAAMDAEHRAMGYDLPAGHCPALVAEEAERAAERLLIECAAEFFPGVTTNGLLCLGLEKHEKFIDLLIGLVVNRPGYRNPLKEAGR